MNQQPKEIASFSEILDKYDNFIFDCDGVVWKGHTHIESGFFALNKLKSLNKNVFFITNNSAKSRKEYHEKFLGFGYDGDIENIYPMSSVGPQYIKAAHPHVKKIYGVGMDGLFEEIKNAGFEAVGGNHESTKTLSTEEDFRLMKVDQGIDAVLLGFDMGFNYYKMAYASLCIQNGAHFFAISGEPFDIVGDKKIPGGGSAVTALHTACGVQPTFLGKPNKYVIDLILEKHGLDPKRTLMTGDRINTDILLGKEGGVDTCLVFTGVTTRAAAEEEFKTENPIIPDYICEALGME